MKRKVLTILILVFSVSILQAQVKGEAEYQVRYDVKFKLDSMNLEKVKHEVHRLYTGTTTSHYISDPWFYMDSINDLLNNNPRGIGINFEAISDPNAEFNGIVYKNLVMKEIWVRDNIEMENFHYKEQGAPVVWEQTQETKEIMDYTVHKATTSYAGRDYEAWFTLDIPILDGPYVFSGLPGLIVELYDANKDYHFSLISIVPLKEKYNINLEEVDSKQITKKQFVKSFKVFKANPAVNTLRDYPDEIKLMSGETISKRELAREAIEREARLNNQIEKW